MHGPGDATPVAIAGVEVGEVSAPWLARALEAPTPFSLDRGALALDPSLADVAARTDALARWAAHARRRWDLPGWRDEAIAIRSPDGVPLAAIERALLRPFGLELRSVQACAWTAGAGGPQIWVARRAWSKPVDPGRLDAAVGGGIAGLDDALATLLRECREEAGLDEAIARGARPAGSLELRYATDFDGLPALHREHVTLYELELPPGCVPVPADGEHESIEPMTPAEALASIDAGGWTREGAQATLDLILRRGWMPAPGAAPR